MGTTICFHFQRPKEKGGEEMCGLASITKSAAKFAVILVVFNHSRMIILEYSNMFSFLCLLFSFSQVNVPRLFRNFSVAAAAVYVVVRSRSFDHLNTSIRQIWSTETYNIVLFRRHASELYVLCRQAVFPSRVFFVRHLSGE